MSTLKTEPSELARHERAGALKRRPHYRIVKYLAIDRLSGVYGWVGLMILFSIWEPSTFLTSTTARVIGSNQAVDAILSAIALIFPLAAGLFDLSVAATLGMACCLALDLQVHGVDPVLTIAACLAAGAAVGVVNGFIVVRLGVSSFIATLGMSSVLAAVTYMITDGNELVTTPRNQSFVNLGQGNFLSDPVPSGTRLSSSSSSCTSRSGRSQADTPTPWAATSKPPGWSVSASIGSCSDR